MFGDMFGIFGGAKEADQYPLLVVHFRNKKDEECHLGPFSNSEAAVKAAKDVGLQEGGSGSWWRIRRCRVTIDYGALRPFVPEHQWADYPTEFAVPMPLLEIESDDWWQPKKMPDLAVVEDKTTTKDEGAKE